MPLLDEMNVKMANKHCQWKQLKRSALYRLPSCFRSRARPTNGWNVGFGGS